MSVASSKLPWADWLTEQRGRSTMQVDKTSLVSATDWGMQDQGARFGRHDGKFFNMVGVGVTTAVREVMGWNQPMLQEVGEGALALLRLRDIGHYLIAARAEPGNSSDGRVLLGPTLQASKSNLERAHGGSLPPRAEFVQAEGVRWVRMPKDGGRFFENHNYGSVIEVDYLEPLSNERWFSRTELAEAISAGECNTHLRELLALAFV